MAKHNWSRCRVLILNYFQYLYKVLPKFYVMFLVKLNLHESHSRSIVKTLTPYQKPVDDSIVISDHQQLPFIRILY